MADVGCQAAVELLNAVFGSGLILNDGHEIYARLQAGDELADIAGEVGEKLGEKLGRPASVADLQRVTNNWPDLHREAVARMLEWSLSKLDTEDRITVQWKGDDHHPETVTKFELRDHTLKIEFAHPPVAALAGNAGG